jgi:hypothetical protein
LFLENIVPLVTARDNLKYFRIKFPSGPWEPKRKGHHFASVISRKLRFSTDVRAQNVVVAAQVSVS